MTQKFIVNIIENGKHDFGEISYTTKKYRYVIRQEFDNGTRHWVYSLYRAKRPDYGKGWQYYMDYVQDVTEEMREVRLIRKLIYKT